MSFIPLYGIVSQGDSAGNMNQGHSPLSPPSLSSSSSCGVYLSSSGNSPSQQTSTPPSPHCFAGIGMNNMPYLKILDQPQQKFRFRYQSEMVGTHGCLMADNHERSKKSHIRVQLHGCMDQEATIRCTLVVNDTRNPIPHVHKLGGEGNGSNGEYQDALVSQKNEWIATFSGLTIIHTAKKQVREVVEERLLRDHRERARMEGGSLHRNTEQKIKDEADKIANTMDLHAVRLKFEAFIVRNGQALPICQPVYSNAIHNLKSTHAGDLRIVRIDKVYSCCTGQEEVFIFVEKVNKKDIKVRFFELNDQNEVIWNAFADFSELDVHHQFAIAFKTPPYRDLNIEHDVTVQFQLYRPSNEGVSDAKSFTYTPRERVGGKRVRQDYAIPTNYPPRSTDSAPGNTGWKGPHENSLSGLNRQNHSDSSTNSGPGLYEHEPETWNAPTHAYPIFFATPVQSNVTQPTSQQGLIGPSYDNTETFQERSPVGQRVHQPPPAYQDPNQDFSLTDVFNSEELRTLLSNTQDFGSQQPAHSNAACPSNISQGLPNCPENFLTRTPNTSYQLQTPYNVDRTLPGHQPVQITFNLEHIQRNQLSDEDPIAAAIFDVGFEDIVTDHAPSVDQITKQLDEVNISTGKPKSGGDVKQTIPKTQVLEEDNFKLLSNYSLNMAVALRNYAETGDLSYLLTRMRHLMAMQSEDGNNALHEAIINNQIDVVRVMVRAASYGLDFINTQNNRKQSALHFAVSKNQPEIVALLLQSAANPNLLDCHGNSPIHLAAVNTNLVDCLRLLLGPYARKNGHTLKLNVRNYAGLAPLHIAVNSSCLLSTKLLVSNGADVNFCEGKLGQTALHLAVKCQSKDIVNYLLNEASVKVNAQSYDGNTALHLAVIDRLPDICAALMAKGADPTTNNFVSSSPILESDNSENDEESEESDDEEDIVNNKGLSPLDLAKGFPMIFNLLNMKPQLAIPVQTVPVVNKEMFSETKIPNKTQDSGIDLMVSKELGIKELEECVIRKLAEILDSTKDWEKLAESLDIYSSIGPVIEKQPSPTSYLLRNLESWDVTTQTILEKLQDLHLTSAAAILEDYLQH